MANLRTNNLFGESGQDSNGSAVFNGTDYLTASNSAAFRLNQGSTEDFTMEAWIYVTGDSYMRIGRIYETSGNQRSYDLYFSDTLELKFNYSSNGTAGGVSTLNAGVVPKNEWIHVAIAHETSTTTLRLFKNGVEKATDNAPHTTYYANTTSDFELGKEFVGNISNFHITKSCKYTGDFTPSKEPIEEDSNTTVLCLNSRFNPLSDDKSNTFTQTSDGGVEASSFIPFDRVDSGNVFNGPIEHNTQGYMYFPTGRTEERGRGRGLMIGNLLSGTVYNTVQYVSIQSMGNAIDFGDASTTIRNNGALASSTRALSAGGANPSTTAVIDLFTIATTSSATDFGDLTTGKSSPHPTGNQTRGIWAGAYNYPAGVYTIDFVTIATQGNASDFGDRLNSIHSSNRSQCNSTTRGLITGGYNPSPGAMVNIIEKLEIATTGDTTDFGDMTSPRNNLGALSSNTRGIIYGGSGQSPTPNVNIIDFVTIATTGDATDFGDLIGNSSSFANSCMSNNIRGLSAGGDTQPGNYYTNIIQHITIATTGNAQDFGDMIRAGAYFSSTSDSHGGLT